jgi:hypothetical protein
LLAPKSKLKLRFFVASDGHYGQPNTAFDDFHKTIVASINSRNKIDKAKFIGINGDIIHNNYLQLNIFLSSVCQKTIQRKIAKG